MNKNCTFSPNIDIDKASAEPLHLQLSRAIRMQIHQYRTESGTRLLSERKLAEAHNLDRSTVHRAYMELIKDGVIEQQPPKKGFFVTSEAHTKLKQPFPTIGVVIPVKFSEYINQKIQVRLSYLNGIIDHAAKFECTIMMIQLPDADKDKAFIKDWLKHVIDRLDGIIHLGDRKLKPDLPLEMLLDYNLIPQVFISAFCNKPKICSIIADTKPGALAAAELLCEKGHQNVGAVSFHGKEIDSSNKLCEYESDRRLERVLDCFDSVGLNVMDKWKLFQCDNVKKIEEKLRNIFSVSPAPTAFWCSNDEIALMTIEALKNIGLKVPEDISVVGYDDLYAHDQKAFLTTIKIPFYSMGCKAVDLLINCRKNNTKTTNQVIKMPTSMVLKDSVGKAKI